MEPNNKECTSVDTNVVGSTQVDLEIQVRAGSGSWVDLLAFGPSGMDRTRFPYYPSAFGLQGTVLYAVGYKRIQSIAHRFYAYYAHPEERWTGMANCDIGRDQYTASREVFDTVDADSYDRHTKLLWSAHWQDTGVSAEEILESLEDNDPSRSADSKTPHEFLDTTGENDE